eukprot:1137333-Pelagomonas_calceolata.AAC.5
MHAQTYLATDAQVEGVPVLKLLLHLGQQLRRHRTVGGCRLAQENVVPHLRERRHTPCSCWKFTRKRTTATLGFQSSEVGVFVGSTNPTEGKYFQQKLSAHAAAEQKSRRQTRVGSPRELTKDSHQGTGLVQTESATVGRGDCEEFTLPENRQVSILKDGKIWAPVLKCSSASDLVLSTLAS